MIYTIVPIFAAQIYVKKYADIHYIGRQSGHHPRRYSDILFQNEIDDQVLAVFGGMPSVSMILKGNSEEEIRACLKSVLGLERFLCHQLSNRILNRKRAVDNNILTASEIEILRFISLGKSVKEIAALRFCSTHTIVTHKKNIFHKIQVNSVYEATRYALRIGLIDTDYYI